MTDVRQPTRVELSSISKGYGGFRALDEVSLAIEPGEFLTLLGPSGSGKTTLLMILSGFTRPDAGAILFDSVDVVRLPPHKREIGVVFQNYALFPHMSVGENVSYPLRLRGLSRSEQVKRSEEALSLVQLSGFCERRINELSGGQMQRVALARAMVFKPKILLMDEPLSALDRKLRESMQIEIRKLHEELKTTTIYVTHDQREALTLSDKVAVMNRGMLEQVDTPERLYHAPRTRFVADFLGETSFLPVRADGHRLTAAGVALKLAREVPAGNYELALRSEKPIRHVPHDRREDYCNTLDGTVTSVLFQGDSMLIQLRVADCVVVVRQPSGEAPPRSGEVIRFYFKNEDVVLIPSDATK